MTQPESKSETSNGVPAGLVENVTKALDNVQLAVGEIDHTNRDLIALTVEVETLREDLEDTLTKSESESRRRGITVAFVGTTLGAVQITDTHVEQCRISPIVHRFQRDNGLSHTQEFFCDVGFPTHNHGELKEIGHGLHTANYIGVLLYALIAIGFVSWWMKAKRESKRQAKARELRNETARETAKIIFNGAPHERAEGVVKDLGP